MMNGGLVGQQVIYPELSYQVVGVLFDAYNELGFGHRENHYQRAVARLLSARGISYRQQAPYKIISRGECVGRYFLDFLIDDKIVLELKCGDYFSWQNIRQVKAYLFVSKRQLAILANFTSSGVRYKRLINTTAQKL